MIALQEIAGEQLPQPSENAYTATVHIEYARKLRNYSIRRRRNGGVYFNDVSSVMRCKPMASLRYLDMAGEIRGALTNAIHAGNRYALMINGMPMMELTEEEMNVLNKHTPF